MSVPKHEVRHDLFCPFCGECGMRPLSDKAQSGRKRYNCIHCHKRSTQPLYSKPQVLPKTKITEIKKHKFFVITSAVNDTPIVEAAHETFQQIAEANNGCYLVIPTVYKNPDLMHQGINHAFTWPQEILPFLCNANVKLNENIVIKGETRIQHTVINPLAGLNHAGSAASEVYAHSQVAMQMIATPRNELPKMLHTTGTISQPNYGGSVRAQKAKFHHSISALIIEVEGDKFWPRQVHFDGEGAHDLNRYYTPDGYTEGWPVAALVYGDGHLFGLEPKIDSLLKYVNKKLEPDYKVFHDLHDQHIGNHHCKDDVIKLLSQSLKGNLSVRDELMLSVKYLNKHPEAYIVDSNHHRHLDQWFNRFIPKRDPLNAPLYFELAELLQEDLKTGGDGNLFRVFVHKYCDSEVNFVDCNERFLIRDIDCSQHGDRGPNGARGSAKGFAASGSKTMIGHSHTPRIEKGCYQVGTMTTNLDYAKGLSSWCNTHGIIYDNGKRALFNIIKNKLSPSMRRM